MDVNLEEMPGNAPRKNGAWRLKTAATALHAALVLNNCQATCGLC